MAPSPTLVAVSVCLFLAGVILPSTAIPICKAWRGDRYDEAKRMYPSLASAIQVVQDQGSAPWYTDNKDRGTLDNMLSVLQSQCGYNTKIPLVVYGIPNKDCEAGYSNAGFNKNFGDYQAFINKLVTKFPTQNMIYIIEPDAVGLTANGNCAIKYEYPKYLKYALQTLSKNPNAELYLDIGFWTLLPTGNPTALARVVNEIWPANGRVKGIALNTANYQRTEDMLQLCSSFASLTGKNDLKCVIDTSRNHRGPSQKGEWCNVKNTGIGVPPTMDTGNSRAAYYLWIKPPGESDGTCTGQTSGDAMVGPQAGFFFKEHFEMLWKNGYFVDKGLAPAAAPTLYQTADETQTTPPPDYVAVNQSATAGLL